MLVCDRLLLLGVSMMIDLWLNLMAWNVYGKTMGRIIIERDATHCLMCVLMTVVMVCVFDVLILGFVYVSLITPRLE